CSICTVPAISNHSTSRSRTTTWARPWKPLLHRSRRPRNQKIQKMKKAIEQIIRKRNPDFRFDEAVTTSLLFALLWEKCFYLLRGMKVLFYLRKPNMLLLGRGVKFFHMANMKFGKWVK